MERSINERLNNSTRKKNILIDPVPDMTPNGLHSDSLATFIDEDNVIADCESDDNKMVEVFDWVEEQIQTQLPGMVRNNPRLSRRLRIKFADSTNVTGAFNPSRLKASVIEYDCVPTPDGEQGKFWFEILLP